MNGSVEMGAGVLASFEGVPIPGGAALVVAGEFAEGERRRVDPLGREREERRGGTETESEIHDAQAARVESFDQLEKDVSHGDPFEDEMERDSRSCPPRKSSATG